MLMVPQGLNYFESIRGVSPQQTLRKVDLIFSKQLALLFCEVPSRVSLFLGGDLHGGNMRGGGKSENKGENFYNHVRNI